MAATPQVWSRKWIAAGFSYRIVDVSSRNFDGIEGAVASSAG